jgi:5'(3')-deoxyribonucleotidase
MRALRIGVDIDEVLTPFLSTMKKWRPPKVSIPQRHRYNYSEIYGISEKESQKMVRDFYESEEFANLPVLPGALTTLKDIKKYHKLFLITGRQDVARAQTEDWVHTNFPGLFTDLVMTNSFTRNDLPKYQVCFRLNIGVMIDDNYDTCIDCLHNGIAGINFIGDPVYPWCHESAIGVKKWEDIYKSDA